MADEIILPLLELLKKLTSLEEEVFKRNSELNKASENLISKGYVTHYSNPSEYFYVDSDDFLLEFDMQRSDVAIIIIHFSGAIDMKHKFIVRQINKKWVVDEKYYGFADEAIWYSDGI